MLLLMDWIKLRKVTESHFRCKRVFTMCLFNMSSSSYKDFNEKYYKPMIKLLDNLALLFNDWGFIIYLDYFMLKTNPEIVKHLLGKYKGDRYLIYFYFIPKFVEGNKHVGTVGTMTRFIPFFDKNDYNMIWCIDIDEDINLFKLTKKYFMDEFEGSNVKFMALANTLHHFLSRHPDNINFIIIAKGFISKIKFPMELINNFMKSDRISYDYDVGQYKSAKKTSFRFPYGGDEWFLNKDLYNYLREHNIYVMVVYNPLIDFFTSIKYCNDDIREVFKNRELNEIYKKMGKYSIFFNNYEYDDINKAKDKWNEYKKLGLELRTIFLRLLKNRDLTMSDRCKKKVLTIYNLNKIYTRDLPVLYYKIVKP